MSNADITYTNQNGSKQAIYRVSLPASPSDWTVDTLRKFVKDADELMVSGDTHVKRDPNQEAFAYQNDNRYYGLCVERVVEL